VSSAYFTIELPGWNGFRSAAVTVYAAGPMPDPWMMLAEMVAVNKIVRKKQSKAKQKKFRRRRRPKPLCPPN